jgi:methylglyoxal synthase
MNNKMKKKKTIALVAHDNRKKDLMDWVAYNWKEIIQHDLVCTGTTGALISKVLEQRCIENSAVLPTVTRLKSGPLGGDQQLGALISERKVDMLIFLWDPMQAQPHDVDVKALLRICAVYNVVTATNRSTADFVVSSSLFHYAYEPELKDYSQYIKRDIQGTE